MTVTTPAMRVALELTRVLPVRTVRAKPRPMREPHDDSLPERLRAIQASGVKGYAAIARAAKCGKSTAWRHLSGKS